MVSDRRVFNDPFIAGDIETAVRRVNRFLLVHPPHSFVAAVA
jgi:hypothetical protein